ncbi:MAG: WD40/YVTN/BNR-like repeat-containing protein, partial [Chitinophagaceae bacterium]
MKTNTNCTPSTRYRYNLSLPLALLFIFGFLTTQGQSRINIFELMERRDLRLSEIEAIARKHFDEVGRVRGTGYKQYERWRYEKQFHVNAQGFLLPENYDALQYASSSLSTMNVSAAADAWTEVGPKTWSRTTSWNPGVGRITSIAVYPADTSIIYITCPGGGIWKSTQGGKQWVPLSDANNSLMNMFSITVDPSNSNVVFAGNSGGELYKSTDGGTTWTLKKSTGGNLRKILIDPTQPQTLFLASSGGLYKSVDGGSTFTKKLAVSIEDIEFKPGDPTTLYASGSSIYRSLDYGETWTQLTALANGITNTGRTLLGVSAADPLVVYAVQSNGSEFGRLYRSADGGNTFTTTITGSSTTCTNFFGYSSNGCGTGGQASYDMAITVNPLNANEVHMAGIICWKSTNGGTSFIAETEWSLPNSTGYNHADVHVLEWVGKTIYSGSDGGIYKSIDNGDNWIDLSLGLGTRQFYRIANSKTSTKLITGGAQDNGSSIYKSSGWIDWLGADGMDCIVSPLDSNLIWGTSQYGSLYRTSNGGSSYSGVSVPRSGNWVTPLAIESTKNIIYGGWKGIWKSTDLGASWTKISIDTNNLVALAV